MSLVILRSGYSRSSGVKSLLGLQICPVSSNTKSPFQIQVATLKSTYGEPYPYDEPYPYKTKKYTFLTEWFDKTMPRLCENSKIITVDGNLAVGKKEFAQRLAKEFDLQYVGPLKDDACFVQSNNGYDVRSVNNILPHEAKLYDLEQFYNEADPSRGRVGILQCGWYYQKWMRYSEALRHLLNTGQGSVIVSSAHSDSAYVDAMYECGYVTKNFKKYYNELFKGTICELWKPHLSIYLDAPLETIKEKIRKRADPREMASDKILNDKYLEELAIAYKENVLPRLSKTGHVLEIDWSERGDDLDMDAIATEIAGYKYEAEDNEDDRFHDWYKHSEDELCWHRRRFGKPEFSMLFFNRYFPTHCPEIMVPNEHWNLRKRLVDHHPAVQYQVGTAPQLGNSGWKVW